MTADNSTTRVVAESGADVGPGERLREAREAAQLTVGEVASRLRLEPRVIGWLENDDYEQLHGPTFVRGYLSGYARLLDLPEGPILEAYERHGFGPPALVSELGRKPEVHVSDFPVRMVTYVIAGLLVVLVVLWWQSRQVDTGTPERAEIGATPAADFTPQTPETAGSDEASSPPSASTAAPAVTDSTTSKVAAPVTPPPTAGTASDTAAEAPETQPTQAAAEPQSSGDAPPVVETLPSENSDAGDMPEQPEPPAQSDDTPVGVVAEASSADQGTDTTPRVTAMADTADRDESGESGTATMAAGDDTSPPSPDAESDAEAASAPPPAPLPGSDVLAIQLTRESWIEIYDRGGGRLYYSLAGEGSEVVVQGAGPMRVLLGEVQGVAVAYNGEPYDLSRFEGRNVVRFTVGELSGTSTPEPPAPTAADEPLTRETQQPTAEGQDQSVANAGEALNAPATPPAAVDELAPESSSATPTAGSTPASDALRPDS